MVNHGLKHYRNDLFEYCQLPCTILANMHEERLHKERDMMGKVQNRIKPYIRQWPWFSQQIQILCASVLLMKKRTDLSNKQALPLISSKTE